MKPKSKYGSVYPETALARPTHRRKTASRDTPGATIDTAAIKLPHERDESVDQGGGGVDSASVRQACKDVKRGLPDTDRGVEMNHTYQKQKN